MRLYLAWGVPLFLNASNMALRTLDRVQYSSLRVCTSALDLNIRPVYFDKDWVDLLVDLDVDRESGTFLRHSYDTRMKFELFADFFTRVPYGLCMRFPIGFLMFLATLLLVL